jgi:hypothetical protein
LKLTRLYATTKVRGFLSFGTLARICNCLRTCEHVKVPEPDVMRCLGFPMTSSPGQMEQAVTTIGGYVGEGTGAGLLATVEVLSLREMQPH